MSDVETNAEIIGKYNEIPKIKTLNKAIVLGVDEKTYGVSDDIHFRSPE